MRIRPPQLFAGPWPDSNAWATKAFLTLLVLAVLCGPIALGVAASHRPAPDSAHDAGVQNDGAGASRPAEGPDLARERALVEASAFVEVWLSATRDQAGQVAAMLTHPPEDLQLPTKRSGHVAADAISADLLPDEGRWVVTVRSRQADGARWWLVEVVIDGDNAAIAALPSQVPQPRRPDTSDRPTLEQLPPTHPAAATASEFLTAMLTGSGDITRWSTPGSALAAVSPAPCIKVAVTSSLPSAAADIPEAGQELDLSVDVVCTTHHDSLLLSQYGLHLQGRDGRWEVANVTTPGHAQNR